MALPEQIRKQSEAIQELYKQLNAEDKTPKDEGVADEAAKPTENPPTEGNDAAQVPSSEDKQEATTAHESKSEETLLQKYKTLQGMFNAEVPRLHQQNRALTQRIQQLEQLLASLSTQQQNSTDASQQQTVEKHVTEKDVEEYGESIDVMRRVAREELALLNSRLTQLESVVRQMQTNVVPQVQDIAYRQQMSAEQKFWADLSAAVPDFREINSNEGFHAWLLEADPLTGITRQTYLEDAQRNLDAQRVINIFRAWLSANGQAAGPKSSRAASELEKQIAPGRSRGGNNVASFDKAKTYTPADIAQFFNDVRNGKYKGREQERIRIERDIFAAQREGRIVFGT